MKRIFNVIILLFGINIAVAEPAATITRIEGTAHLLKSGATAWKTARLNMPLQEGDQLKSSEESLVEITYRKGAIMRLDENSVCSIQKSGNTAVTTSVPKGNVWVNMKKLTAAGNDFEVSTPTAVAAIRGTIFQLQSLPDSAADVAVFDGNVAVGLSDDGKKRNAHPNQTTPQAPHEIPGPTEVPGPFEVPLEQWTTIVAGQRISIRSNGTYATTKFELSAKLDSFVEKNRALDSEIKGAH